MEGFGLSSYCVDMVLQAEVSVKQVLAVEILATQVLVLTSLVWLVFLMSWCNLINIFPVKIVNGESTEAPKLKNVIS